MAQIRKKTLKSKDEKGKPNVSYEVRINRSGGGTFSKSFRDKESARKWANEIESKLDTRQLVNVKHERTLMEVVFAEFAAHYVSEKTGQPINGLEEGRLKILAHDFEGFAVGVVSHEMIKNYIKKMLDQEIPVAKREKVHPLYKGHIKRNYSPSTVRKLYYQLKKAMEWHARTNGYRLDERLFEKQPIPAAWGGARERRLQGDEEQRLYDAARHGYDYKEESVRIIGFALETGMRAQEILLMRWQDFKIESRTVNIPKEHVKTGTFRQVPLSKRAVAILQEQLTVKSAESKRVFWQWKDSNHLGHHFRRICHRAKIEDLVFHDLRHEATSRFFEKGKLRDREIMEITGHTQYSTFERYVQLRESSLVDKMD